MKLCIKYFPAVVNVLLTYNKTGAVKYFCVISVALAIFFPVAANAQNIPRTSAKTNLSGQDTIVPFKSRWSVKTNAVDWLAMLPNATVEFDLSNSVYNRLALNLGVKWNWQTRQNYVPAIVYNVFDVRAELRYYYRTELRNAGRPTGQKRNVLRKLKEDVFSKQKLHPRFWRAYYIGGYLGTTDFTLKLGQRGIQGKAYGLGVSAGFAIPLYGYSRHAIDLELGGSIGMQYTKFAVFQHDPQSNCYPRIPEKSKGWHLTPFPVVTDLRVAFVYRFSSVKNKYRLVDHKKIQAKQQKKFEEQTRKDSLKEVRFKEKELKNAFRDSVRTASRLQKLTDKFAKEQADSLRKESKTKRESRKKAIVPTDSLNKGADAMIPGTIVSFAAGVVSRTDNCLISEALIPGLPRRFLFPLPGNKIAGLLKIQPDEITSRI